MKHLSVLTLKIYKNQDSSKIFQNIEKNFQEVKTTYSKSWQNQENLDWWTKYFSYYPFWHFFTAFPTRSLGRTLLLNQHHGNNSLEFDQNCWSFSVLKIGGKIVEILMSNRIVEILMSNCRGYA